MSNSPLVDYTKLSPNHSGNRTHSIDRISPHCVVGQASVESLGRWFDNPSLKASCNYAIGADGRVALIVDEARKSWCTSSNSNDQRAVTIECASDKDHPYAFRDEVYQKLIELCVDICKRNGKKKLLWLVDKDKTLAYEPAPDEMVLTVHRWFANKACPGDWMMAHMADLAAKVTQALTDGTTGSAVETQKTDSNDAVVKLSTIKRGSEGSQVRSMQFLLVGRGYSCGSTKASLAQVDGEAGYYTILAVKKFQKDFALDVDGICGPITWAKLLGAS